MSDDADRNGVTGPDDRRAEDVDALEILRASNAVDPAGLPTADGPHARALYEEIVAMPTDTGHRPAPATPTPRRRLAVSVLALVAIGVGTVIGLNLISSPTVQPDPAPVASDPDPGEVQGGGFASCAFEYTPETLAERELAFDGVITGVDGDDITFDVGEVFTGEVGDTVTLGGGVLLVGGGTVSAGESDLAVGDRALVAGDGGFAWACGFTQPYDDGVAAQWRATFS